MKLGRGRDFLKYTNYLSITLLFQSKLFVCSVFSCSLLVLIKVNVLESGGSWISLYLLDHLKTLKKQFFLIFWNFIMNWPLFSRGNSHQKKVRADSASPRPNRVKYALFCLCVRWEKKLFELFVNYFCANPKSNKQLKQWICMSSNCINIKIKKTFR